MQRLRRISAGDALLVVFCVVVLAFLILPILAIVAISFTSGRYLEFPMPGLSLQWYANLLDEPKWIDAGVRSLVVAAATVVLSATLGTLAALGLATGRIPGRDLVRGLILSPLIIPKIITAVALFLVLSPLKLIGTTVALIAGHTIIALPFVFLIMSAALLSYDRRLTWAAMTLGANPRQTFFYVTLPALVPNVIAACLFAFLESFDDVIIALFVGGIALNTLPKLMYVSVQEEITPSLAAMSAMLVGVTIVVGALSALVLGKRA